METMEIIIYIGIALLVGGLIIGFLAGWDAQGTYNSVKGVFSKSSTSSAEKDYESIKSDDLPGVVLTFWEGCGLGSVAAQKTVYVKNDAELSKEKLFSYYKQYNVCKSIQSKEQGCGSREDVTFAQVKGPVVLSLVCKDNSLTISS
jgi:hypothetical protein